jgi:hypothetical protein
VTPAFGRHLLLAAAPQSGATRLRQLQANRAGIYYRLSERDDGQNSTHPLVDAVVMGVRWRDVEPAPGKFDFRRVQTAVDTWKRARKGVVLNLILYGQGVDDLQTPPWVYQAGTEAISFPGGGRAKGQSIRIPKVWDPSFLRERLDPLVAAFARQFNGQSGVWYAMVGLGHNGNLVAQPAKTALNVLEREGWTPEVWRGYCQDATEVYRKHFTRTPLIVKANHMLVRSRREDHFSGAADQILEDLGRSDVSIIALGLSANLDEVRALHARIAPLADLAAAGRLRLGVGDDWPLWVPEKRQGKAPTRGRDDAGFAQILERAFGGTDGLPEVPITILFVQEPEVSASRPRGPAFRPAVHDTLQRARDRLLQHDRRIFGR